MPENYSILVNSSDGFEDCWHPFFLLFKKYWPQCAAPIYLNTEKKIWNYSDLPVQSTAVQGDQQRRLTWSECLIGGLDQIKTPLVLYFQEDYFIHKPVRAEAVASAVEYMIANPDVKHMALTRHASLGPYENYTAEGFVKIRQKAKYRISTQAALWRVDTLRSYLLPEENGWMFEILGTWRAHKRADTFLCAKFDEQDGGPVIDYLHTGIIKGKWLKAIAPVFQQNGIVVDFSKRGFYEPKPPLLHKIEVAQKLLQKPGHVLKQLL